LFRCTIKRKGKKVMNKSIGSVFLALVLLTVSSSCSAVPTSTPPTVPIQPTDTVTPVPTSTATPRPTPTPTITATPWPSGRMDTGMNGTLSIQGVVKDDLGKAVPNAYVTLSVYGAKGGWDIGQFARWGLYTDGTGSYSFDKVVRLESGHYEIWFNGDHEYGKAYENSGYYIEAHKIESDVRILDVTVHPITGSVFSGIIQYEDVDGTIKGFYSPPFTKSEPGHFIELFRGNPDNMEYPIGSEYGRINGGTIEWSGLAGGTYFLKFTYRRLDGVLVNCHSPSFEIPPGETKDLEYTIRNCPPSSEPLLQ
jgi:hypothetical protein